MSRYHVIGNWKMHGSKALVHDLIYQLKALSEAQPLQQTQIAVCPPLPYLQLAAEKIANSAIKLGAQDVSVHAQGAYTGQVAASMLQDIGCQYVIVGHSERRTYCKESDHDVAQKAIAALENGLTPIVCVGESLAERESEQTTTVISKQVQAVLNAIEVDVLPRIMLAYEPIWAIGTGLAATPEQAQAVHQLIRQQLMKLGKHVAGIPILYGGSVKPDNALTLFSQPDIDGGLIGGAALDAQAFWQISLAAESN